jgi:hypothetical protein
MEFEHEVREESKSIERTESYHAEHGDYQVLVTRTERLTELAIYPKDFRMLRLGIISCHPRTVADIEKFGKIATDLFAEIARSLRHAGLDDLRGEHERKMDEFEERRQAGGQS